MENIEIMIFTQKRQSWWSMVMQSINLESERPLRWPCWFLRLDLLDICFIFVWYCLLEIQEPERPLWRPLRHCWSLLSERPSLLVSWEKKFNVNVHVVGDRYVNPITIIARVVVMIFRPPPPPSYYPPPHHHHLQQHPPLQYFHHQPPHQQNVFWSITTITTIMVIIIFVLSSSLSSWSCGLPDGHTARRAFLLWQAALCLTGPSLFHCHKTLSLIYTSWSSLS